jgi:curved DNA-binding protein CbpA
MAIEYKDYYEILELKSDAGEEEIRRAFRRLARLLPSGQSGE